MTAYAEINVAILQSDPGLFVLSEKEKVLSIFFSSLLTYTHSKLLAYNTL